MFNYKTCVYNKCKNKPFGSRAFCKKHYPLYWFSKWHKKRYKKLYKKLCQGIISKEEYMDERIPTADLASRNYYLWQGYYL